MSKVSSRAELLTDCLHDLADGERQLGETLGAIAGHVSDGELRDALKDIADQADSLAGDLDSAAAAVDAPEPDAANIWMRGILDDAQRDTEMIEPGMLLDLALIGAVRKALAAAFVSYETAVAVSAVDPKIVPLLTQAKAGKRRADDRLAALLQRLAP